MGVKRRKDDFPEKDLGKKRKENLFGKDIAAKKRHIKHNVPDTATREKKTNTSDKVPKTITISVAEADEPDFPRGGASALTAEEIRETRLQAESEFKEEIKKQKKGKSPQQQFNGARIMRNEESLLIGKLPTSAEILRYKSLTVGMKIWGAVSEVNDGDLTVSLPGGLRGFVRAEEASDALAEFLKDRNARKLPMKRSKRKEKQGAGKEIDNELISQDAGDLSSDEVTGLSLKQLFSVGQLVACRIKTLEQMRAKGDKKGSKRIGLSLRLSYLHEGLTVDVFQEGLSITGCVTSVEDHGYLLTFGVPGVSGFLLQQNCEGKSKLKRGQLVQGLVLSIDKKRGTVSLKTGQTVVAGGMVQEHEGLTMELLLPGSLVSARVKAVLRNGLLLSFLTYFTGTVDMFHLDTPLLGSKWSEKYAENLRLKAKILYVDPLSKVVGLTLNPDLLRNAVPSLMVNMGETFDSAIVRRVDRTIGLLLELPSKPTPSAGYAHISNVSDEHIEKLEKKFSEGKKVRARVTGFRMMDGLAIVSLKKTVLEQLLLSYADVKPGMVVYATVIAVESFGAILQLGDGLKGLCPLQHMSEHQRVTPSPKFQVGARLKFRVLLSDIDSKKITLTHKKSLVSSKLTPITSYEVAVEGLVTHGWITGIVEYGCFVSFYNNVKGLAHRTELGVAPGVKPDTVFHIGQCVKCRVLRSDSSSHRLSISFRTSPARDEEVMEHEIRPGSIVSGTVVHLKEKSITLDVLLPTGLVKGILPYSHLSDTPGHIEHEHSFKTLLKPGYKFDRLLVLEKSSQKLILSAKFSLLQAATTLPHDISQLHTNAVYQGFIANITADGCFVRFLSRLTGLATVSQVADAFVADPSQIFSVGQSVRAQVLEVKEEVGKFYVSLKQSVCFSMDATLLQGYFIEEEKLFDLSAESTSSSKEEWSEELRIGSYVDGEIQDVKEFGVIMSLYKHKDIVGFLTHHQLGTPVEVGKKVKARVLDVVKVDGIVDLTLRPELFPQQELVKATAKKGVLKKRSLTDYYRLELQEKVTALVELVKDEYLVLSLPEYDNTIAFASTRDYNLRAVDPSQMYQPGQRLTGTVQTLPNVSTGGRLLLLLNKSVEDGGVFSVKKQRKNFKCDVGSLVQGEIVSLGPLAVTLAVGKNFKGSIHITEVWDDVQEGHPFSDYQVGQTLTAKVLAKVRVPRTQAGSGDFHLELSVRPSELAESAADLEKNGGRPSFDTVKVGDFVTAYVQEINEERAWLLVGPHLRGRLFVLDSSNVPSILREFRERFKAGHVVRCRVSGKDLSRGTLDLSLREVGHVSPASFTSDIKLVDGSHAEEPQQEIKPGLVLGGRVSRVYPGAGGLSVQIGAHSFGRVHVSHFSDIWEDFPSQSFQEGQFVRCVVLDVVTSFDAKPRIDLSLKSSLGGEKSKSGLKPREEDTAVIETLQDLSLGLLTQGYVKSVSKKGCFVALSKSVDARILLSELSDSFVADPYQSFPPGKLVKGRITSLEPLSGRVEMSLRTSSDSVNTKPAKGGIQRACSLEDFNVGDIVHGQIRRVESFGIFVAIDSSSVVGMCHVSEVSDSYVKNIQQLYNVGQKVHVKVLKVDTDKQRISFGLKESYLGDSSGTKAADAWNSGAQLVGETIGGDADNVPDEAFDFEDDVLDAKTENDSKYREHDNDDLQVLVASKCEETSKVLDAVPPLQVDLDLDESEPDSKQDGEAEVEDLEIDKDGEGSTKGNRRARQRLKKEREAEIRAAEEKRLQQNQTPETIDDFEQLVHTSPNSSFIWIKYMAFMLSMADVDKAREIAERALKTINFREEGEKLNVWVAYLNLENAYGSPKKEAVLKLFQKAVQYCDPKKLHLGLLGIYERTEQHEMSDELLRTMIRKFKTSAKVWLRNIQNLLKRGMEDGAQKSLEQCLLSLPRRKHVKVLSHVAVMEFKIGSPERARAIFEGVVRNYPKRTDLWSVYLDQEIRLGDLTVVRALFERAVSLELPPKKIKFLFKKFLDFEKANGNEERAEYVKSKAMEYVEAKLG